MNWDFYLGLSPFLVVTIGGALLMMTEAFGKPKDGTGDRANGPSAALSLGTTVTLLAGAVFAAGVWLAGPEKLQGIDELAPHLMLDRFTLFFAVVLCLGGALASLLAGGYLPEHRLDRGEFYPLITFSTVGAMMLVAAGDLLTLFVGLETMSLGVYAMTGFRRGSGRSTEASVKYFLLGSFAAALLVYGGALLYGATAKTDLAGIGQAISTFAATPEQFGRELALIVLGAALIVAGLAFKVSAVPFHMWTPDAYEGAPTPATTFMAVAVKSAAFGVLLRVLLVAFGGEGLASWASGWPPIIAVLALATMTIANIIAGRQESVKRMLAYSSVAHAGYVLVAVAAAAHDDGHAQASIMFYLLTYTVSTVGALGALILCGSRGAEAVSYEDLAGVGRRHPAAGLAFSLFLLSLAGVPPTAGFFGKLYLVKAAMGSGLYILSIGLLLNSALAAYYYLRVLVYMYMREPAPGAAQAVPMKSGYVSGALVVSAILVLFLGLWPSTPLELAHDAALSRLNGAP